MAAAEVDPEVTDTVMGPAEQQQMFNIMLLSQRGRMDEQRCTLNPSQNPNKQLQGFHYQGPAHHGSSPQISVIESTPDMNRKTLLVPPNHFQMPPRHDGPVDPEEMQKMVMNIVSHGQRGRMDDQRCAFDPSRSAPSTPTHTDRKPVVSLDNPDSEKFFNLLAHTQGQRLDDQRAALPSLPKAQVENDGPSADGSGYLCYMVSKVQGSRMDDQRCSLPQILPTDSHLSTNHHSGSGITRSASFSPGSDLKSKDDASPKRALTPSEEKDFLSIMNQTQRGRMEEQRCVLSPKPKPKQNSNQGTGSEGVQNGGSSSAMEKDASYLCYMVSKVQGSRMDEQRCSAPHILENLCTPSAQRKETSDKLRFDHLKHAKSSQDLQELSPAEKDRFYEMISHAQSRRMEDQRCSLPPSSSTPATPTHHGSAVNNALEGADADAFFKAIATSQARRLDDQRVALPSLPGISGDSRGKQSTSTPKITVAGSTPTTSRRNCSASSAAAQMPGGGSPRGLPKSASFSPGTEYQKAQNSPAQVTVRVSMSFTPQMAHKAFDQPGTFPEVFLTLGAPGDNLVIPLSPAAGRPLSLNLNLVPKEGYRSGQCSPCHTSPRRARSRPASPKPGCATRIHAITPDEDCFPLIEKVHASQLDKGGRHNMKGDHGKGKGRTDQGKGKGGGKKEKKNGGHKH
ncbi:uncharacterized protein ACB058_020694 [Synchiropus picturatus]